MKPTKAKAGGQNTGHNTEIHNCKNSTNQGGHVEVQKLTEVDTSTVQDLGTGETHRKQRRVRGKTKKNKKVTRMMRDRCGRGHQGAQEGHRTPGTQVSRRWKVTIRHKRT